MRTIEQLKKEFVNLEVLPIDWLGDSPTRFNKYQEYASKVDSIVEFGVYTGLSTTAFLSGAPRKLTSYDITDTNLTVLDELYAHARQHNIDFKFQIGNSLEVEIEECDLLFIDTVHKKSHCAAELTRHADKVKKYIIFHDTTAFPGVFQAAVDFLIGNQSWHIVEHCNIDSGLLILKKYA